MKEKLKKLLIGLLSLALFAGMLPAAVHAEGQEYTPEEIYPTAIKENVGGAYEEELLANMEEQEGDSLSAETSDDLSVEEKQTLYRELTDRMRTALLAGEYEIDTSDLNLSSTFFLNDIYYSLPYFGKGIYPIYYDTDSQTMAFVNTHELDETTELVGIVDQRLAEIDALMTDGMTDAEKALAIHDYLTYHFEYDYENYKNGTIPNESYKCGGLLMNGTGVCNAYAYAYEYLLTREGVDCQVTSSYSMSHAWNIVKIGDHYYHVDCTWDDPVPDKFGQIRHTYFLVSDTAMQNNLNHYGWDRTDLVCDDTSYDSAYWTDIESQIIPINGKLYYIKGSGLYCRTGNTEEKLTNLGYWKVWQSSSWWVGGFSGLFYRNGYLYYNTSTKIMRMSLETLESEAVYTPDTSAGYIYGMREEGSTLRYLIKQSPNASDDDPGTYYTVAFSTLDPSEPCSHSWDAGVITTEPTYEAAGVRTYTCTLCGETKTEEIPKLEKEFPFTDVSETDWFYDKVKYVYENSLMSGMTADTFAPDEPLTRAQFATILYRMNGAPEVSYSDTFSDVPEGQWYTNGILWASSVGVVSGYSDGSYGTDDKITREQMAVMMYRYAKAQSYDTGDSASLDAYTDASSVSSYATEAIRWAVGSGIISGKTSGTLDPQGNATRAECATIIMRFAEKYQ